MLLFIQFYYSNVKKMFAKNERKRQTFSSPPPRIYYARGGGAGYTSLPPPLPPSPWYLFILWDGMSSTEGRGNRQRVLSFSCFNDLQHLYFRLCVKAISTFTLHTSGTRWHHVVQALTEAGVQLVLGGFPRVFHRKMDASPSLMYLHIGRTG